MIASFWIKFNYLCLWKVYSAVSSHLFPHLTILGSCNWKKPKQLTSFFYASALLLIINFVITLSKLTAEPLSLDSWFLWRNLLSIKGKTHKKLSSICEMWSRDYHLPICRVVELERSGRAIKPFLLRFRYRHSKRHQVSTNVSNRKIALRSFLHS